MGIQAFQIVKTKFKKKKKLQIITEKWHKREKIISTSQNILWL